MKAVAMAVVMLLSGLAQAAGSPRLPVGTYAGSADWRGPGGSSGTYSVEKTFLGNSLTARYTWSDAQAHEEKHTVTFAGKSAEPVFDVVDDKGQVVGKGYCYDDACSYRATFGPVSIEETFRWSKDDMSVLGAKSGPGFSVVWTELLKAR